jgi:hypothetical protein
VDYLGVGNICRREWCDNNIITIQERGHKMNVAYIIAIIIAVLAFITYLIKHEKVKKVLVGVGEVLKESHKALDDGKITKEEWLQIGMKALEQLGLG